VGARLPHDYMRQDIYLVKWLRDKRFDLEEAEKKLMDNLEWRERNGMDSILSEDWRDLESDYRYSIEGCDVEGRPVISAFLGDWDMRKLVLSGQSGRLTRYIDKLIEEVVTLVRSSQERGLNITQFSLILDLSNYNLAQHGCPQCIPVQLHFLRTIQEHYPGNLHRLHVINTPRLFQPVLHLMKPLFSERAKQILSFYGRDKEEWQRALLKESRRDRLTKALGGTREVPYEMEYFKQLGYIDCRS